VSCVYIFNMQEEDILEHTDGECHLCTLWSICRLLCTISMHLITLLNILTGKIVVSTLECQVPWGDTYDEIVNYHLAYTPQNRVSDISTHMTLNIINIKELQQPYVIDEIEEPSMNYRNDLDECLTFFKYFFNFPNFRISVFGLPNLL
jgi:hypothetical protein